MNVRDLLTRVFGGSVLLLGVGTAMLVSGAGGADTNPTGRAVLLDGQGEIVRANGTRVPLVIETPVDMAPGDTLRSIGAKSEAVLHYGTEGGAVLYGDAAVRPTSTRLLHIKGTVSYVMKPGYEGPRLITANGNTQVVTRGTSNFFVKIKAGGTTVASQKGSVKVSNTAGGGTVQVKKGSKTEVRGDHRPTRPKKFKLRPCRPIRDLEPGTFLCPSIFDNPPTVPTTTTPATTPTTTAPTTTTTPAQDVSVWNGAYNFEAYDYTVGGQPSGPVTVTARATNGAISGGATGTVSASGAATGTGSWGGTTCSFKIQLTQTGGGGVSVDGTFFACNEPEVSNGKVRGSRTGP